MLRCFGRAAALVTAVVLLARAAHADFREHTARYLADARNAERVRVAFGLQGGVTYHPLAAFQREGAGGDDPVSDLHLLRAMGVWVPGVDAESELGAERLTRLREAGLLNDVGHLGGALVPAVRQGEIVHLGPPGDGDRVTVTGAASTFSILYNSGMPSDAKKAFEFATNLWADVFQSDVEIRIRCEWKAMRDGSGTLGATASPYFVSGKDGSKLRDDAVYSPVMAAALEGKDMIDSREAHIIMIFNANINWHTDIKTATPFVKYDLPTTALHELCHGLFFAGPLQANRNLRTALFENPGGVPGRFDQFMAANNGNSVARSCRSPQQLYTAVTAPGLRFQDSSMKANFALYAPNKYIVGSSTYHLDTRSLGSDCEGNGISTGDCSDLMTHELRNGYTQRVIGESTLRIMRAVRGDSNGIPSGGDCKLVVTSSGDEDSDSPEASISTGRNEPFRLPLWAMITVGVVAGVGAIFVVYSVGSSIVRR